MYTIKWVADQIGVPAGTLRAWEQRYGVVAPTRTEAGHRVYNDRDLTVLRTMARLVSNGIQPAQAAAHVLSEPPAVEAPLPARPKSASGLPEPADIVVTAIGYDVAGLEATLDAAFSTASFEHVIDNWLMPAMIEVGDAWNRGDLDVAQEHLVSNTVMRRLAAAFDAAGHATYGPHVLIGLVPGATHQISALAFATMLRRAGLEVTYLGPDLPIASWVEAVRSTHPDAVVVSAPLEADARAALEVVGAIREDHPATRVHVGGRGAAPTDALPGATLSQSRDWLVASLAGH